MALKRCAAASSGMILQNLASEDQSWSFSHGYLEEYCPRNIVSTAMYLAMVTCTLGPPGMSTGLFGLSLAYWYGY
jgi:hypothetical protein